MISPLLKTLGDIVSSVAGRIFPKAEDELKKQELQQALQVAIMAHSAEVEKAAAEIIKAEAQGESWLQRSWRPITMLTFVSLIVARWLGWSAPNLGSEEVLKLWDIVEIGIGGYVIGRTAEKIIPNVADMLKKE